MPHKYIAVTVLYIASLKLSQCPLGCPGDINMLMGQWDSNTLWDSILHTYM